MVKLQWLILLAILFITCLSFAQTFNLNSKFYKTGNIYAPFPKISFHYNKYSIRKQSFSKLDSLAKYFKKNDSLIIEIGVHTDSRGSTGYSRKVTQRRAQSIMEYLITKGLNPDRFIAKGHEDNVPLKIDSAYFQKTFFGTKKTKPTAKDYFGIDGRTKEKVFASFLDQKTTFISGIVLNEAFIKSLKDGGLIQCAHQMNRRTEFKIIGMYCKDD